MANQPIEWIDSAIHTKERHILTEQTLQVPGLRMIGHHSVSHAIAALDCHYHPDCFEFTYMAHGNLRFSVDGHSYPLSGGDLFITFPNEIHDTGSIPMSVHQIYWFQLDVSDPDHLLFMESSASRRLVELLYALPTRVIKLPTEKTTDLLSQIFKDLCQEDALHRMQGVQLLGFFLYYLLEYAESPRFPLTPDIRQTIDYIFEHISEKLSMEQLAHIALLSESRFKQKFKLQMGTSPRDFVNFHKIEAAKRLLMEGSPVNDVARKLSFSSSNYFSDVFRRYTSFSPSQYQQTMADASHISPDNKDYMQDDEAVNVLNCSENSPEEESF